MIRDLFKWFAPGLAIVLGGTALVLVTTSANIANDVGAQSAAAMQSAGYDWAELAVDVRDLVLSGTTTDHATEEEAVSRLASLPGTRSVIANVTLAPLAKPYVLEASIADGVVSLSGGVPDEATRQLLLSQAGVGQGALELRSGMPDRRVWLAGAQYAIAQLKYFDQARVVISDLAIDLEGRAKSSRDYRDLLIVMRAGAPAGLSFDRVRIAPALVSPYKWSATSDGSHLSIEGFAPSEAVIELYRVAEVSGLLVATGLALASGEPQGFAELSQILVEQLSRLEYGTATITDSESFLTGAPPSAEVADDIIAQLQSSGSIVVLDPPRIEDYWFSATRQPGGLTIFDGYAPDEATREKLAQLQGGDTTWLKLGRGAPERYQSALEYGLAALDRLSEGRFALRDNVVTLSGVAASGADYAALVTEMAGKTPQGLVLARAEILAPRAAQFNWTASKDSTGVIALSGMVPNPDVRAALVAEAGSDATDATTFASGEPGNFVDSAKTALGLLHWLREGQIEFDGAGWLITGSAKSAIDKAAIEAAFASRQLASSGWFMAIAEAQPVDTPTSVDSGPYLWSINKASNDALAMSGLLPSEALRSDIAAQAEGALVDNTTVSSDAPLGFSDDALLAVGLLAELDEGSVRFDGLKWTVEGLLRDAASAARVETALSLGAASPVDWQLQLVAPSIPTEVQADIVAEVEQPVDVAQAQPPAPQSQAATVDPDYAFSATRSADGAVMLIGQLPSESAQSALVALTSGDTAAVSIAPGEPADFLQGAEAGLRALMQLSEGRLDFSSGEWQLSGLVADKVTRDRVMEAIADVPGEKTWKLTVDVTPPTAEVAEPQTPLPNASAAADVAACEEPLADFSARNSILFQSGAAIIADGSEAALDELATDLAACPDAVVHIEGHTDSDGDEQLNLALSVARAEAVVAALVERGVAPARLYAVGYGETKPIADNDTASGKRLNRRIVVTVKGEHY